jgi:hypothetical protein
MIDDQTVNCLLDQFAWQVLRDLDDGRTLEEIDDDLIVFLRKVDRIAVLEHVVERFLADDEELADEIVARKRAIVAQLRALKRRKRSPASATILPFRPEDRPT